MTNKKLLKAKIIEYKQKLKEFKEYIKQNEQLLNKKFYIVGQVATKTNLKIKEFLRGEMKIVISENKKYITWQKNHCKEILEQYNKLMELCKNKSALSEYQNLVRKIDILEKKFNDLRYIDPQYPEVGKYTLDSNEKDVYKKFLVSKEIKELKNNIDQNYSIYKFYFAQTEPMKRIIDLKEKYNDAVLDIQNREKTLEVLIKIEKDYTYLNQLHNEIQQEKGKEKTSFYDELQL